MIGLCMGCKDPVADLRVDKMSRKVFCANDGCGAEKTDITSFAIQAMLDNKDYLNAASNTTNTLDCAACNASTPSRLEKVAMDTQKWANTHNSERYNVLCTICENKKEVGQFMLNALIESA